MFTGCNNLEKGSPINTTTNSDRNYYLNEALKKGDTLAYHQLSLDYMDSPYDGFLYPAFIMANRHDYHLVYLEVYYVLTDYFHKKETKELEDLVKQTRVLALQYLNKGAVLGNKECERILSYIEYVNISGNSRYRDLEKVFEDYKFQTKQ